MSRDALIVGINTYKLLPGLKAPARDAEAIAKQLHSYGEFRVHRLPEVIQSGQPQIGQKTAVTLRELETALINLFKPKGSNIPQTALFYFSGHGIQRDAGIQEGYLALSDSNPEKGIYGLSLFWLRRLLQESPVRQRIVILDCCHSGEFLNFLEADPGARPGTDRLFMAASREYETAYESLESPYSIFTKAILTGLDPSRLESRVVTNHSLTDWVSHSLKGEIQQPLFESSGSEIVLTRALNGQAIAPQVVQSQDICPYRGLECFDEEHAEFFFGREEATAELVSRLKAQPFTALVGASGVGKSSLIRAGLIAHLNQHASHQWRIKCITPGERPLTSLASAFIHPELKDLERAEQLRRAESFLQAGAKGLMQLVQASLPTEALVAASRLPSTTQRSRMLLIIDQFEEVFTLSKGSQAEQERQQFFDCLMGALEGADSFLSIVIVLRADFQVKCSFYEGLAQQIKQHCVIVNPLKYEQVKSTILKPAQKVGLVCEPSLIYNMLLDVIGAPGELPLLQYTLSELWKQRRIGTEGGIARLTLEAYQELGGVRGTLQKRATDTFYRLAPDEQQVAKRIFLALTQLGEGTEDTRRRVLKSELVSPLFPMDLVERVLEKLVLAKLIVTSHESLQRHCNIPESSEFCSLQARSLKPGLSCSQEIVNVAHETLIRHWSLLRGWLEENREMLRRLRRIEQAAQEWDSAGQPLEGEYLLHGLRLRDAEDFQRTYAHELSALAQQYVGISYQEIRRVRRESRQLQFAVPSVLLIALAAVFSQYQGVVHSQIEKDQQLQLATSRERAAIAQTILQDTSSDPMTALLVSRLAAESGPSRSYEAQSSLRSALQDLRLQLELQGHQGQIHQLVFSPDHQHLATAGADGTIRVWAIQAHILYNDPIQPIQTLNWAEPDQGKPEVTALSFSADGHKILALAKSAAGEKQNLPIAKVWSVDSGNVTLKLTGAAAITQAIFSPDGQWIATAHSDRTLSIWQANTGERVTHVTATAPITQLKFSSQDQLLSASTDGVQLWRWRPTQGAKLQPIAILPGKSTVQSSFSSSGRWIATVTADGKAQIWEATGQLRQTLALSLQDASTATLLGSPLTLQFNFKEDSLAIANSQQAWLWDLKTGKLRWQSTSAIDQLQSDQLQSDQPQSQLQSQLQSTQPQAVSVAFSPDDRFMVTAIPSKDGQGMTELWNVSTGQSVDLIKVKGSITATQFSLDSAYLATAGQDGVIRLWATESGGEFPTLSLPNRSVAWSLFSPSASAEPRRYLNQLIAITLEGKLQNWRILPVPLPDSSAPPVSPSSLPLHTANIESQGVWQLFSFIGQRSQQINSPLKAWPDPAIGQASFPEENSTVQINAVSPAEAAPAIVASMLPGEVRSATAEARLSSVAFSSTGDLIATADAKGWVELQRIQADRSTQVLQRIRNRRANMGQSDRLSQPTLSSPDPASSALPTDSASQSHATGEPLTIRQLSFSPNGRQLLGVGDDLTVRLWDTQTGQLIHLFQGHRATIQQARFSPDGQQIVTASWDRTVRIWQISSGQTVSVLQHPDAVSSASFSPDGQQIVTAGGDGNGRIWNLRTGQLRLELTEHSAEVLEAHFSPDGRQLVTASADGTAILWDAATGLRQASLRPNAASNSIPDPLIQAYFSPDGQYVAAQTQSGKIHLWAATWEMLLKLARSRSLRQLTADECDRYLQLDSNQCPKLPL